MKKNVLLMLAVLCVEMAQAQLSDTVRHRNRNYYYSHWYDTTGWYQNPDYWFYDPIPANVHFTNESYLDGHMWSAYENQSRRKQTQLLNNKKIMT